MNPLNMNPLNMYFNNERIGRDLLFDENIRNIVVNKLAQIHELINYNYPNETNGRFIITQENKNDDKIFLFEIIHDEHLKFTIEYKEITNSKIRKMYEITVCIKLDEEKTTNMNYIEKLELSRGKMRDMFIYLHSIIDRFNTEHINERIIKTQMNKLHIL